MKRNKVDGDTCMLNVRVISDHSLAGEVVFLNTHGIVPYYIEGLICKNQIRSKVLIQINWKGGAFTILSGVLISVKDSITFKGNLFSNYNHFSTDFILKGKVWKDEFYFEIGMDLIGDFRPHSLKQQSSII